MRAEVSLQNVWTDGEPSWQGIQLDEVAFRDPYPMVMRASAYLVRLGPVTLQEPWEEVSGYSPSTLASDVAALICAACFARERSDETAAKYCHHGRDFCSPAWPGITSAFFQRGRTILIRTKIRIMGHHHCEPPAGRAERISSERSCACRFLELVRHGIRKPVWIPSRSWTPC
jgi:glucoamylase